MLIFNADPGTQKEALDIEAIDLYLPIEQEATLYSAV